jgi:hypothetical protein
MTDLADLSVDATESSTVGRQIFDREGVLVVKGFFPPAIIRSVASFLRDSLDQVEVLFRQYGFSLKDEDAAARLAEIVAREPNEIPEKHKHLFQGHFPLEVRLAEALRGIARFANTQQLLFDLLATRRLFAHMPPTARYVLPHCALAAVPPHQDISYNKHMGVFCVVWVPLVPIDAACGGMAAYPKTNNAAELLAGSMTAESNGWLPPIGREDLTNVERVILAPLDLGDAVLLGPRTVHESMPNNSDRVRLSCDFRFFGEQSHSTKHYLDLASDTIVTPTMSES